MAASNAETPLQHAAQLIASRQQADSKFPEISELLHASSSSEYELAIPTDWQVVTKQRMVALPDALFEQYDLLECRCFMGLFPEIKRAWITVDHRLFLWNYEDEADFYTFEEQEQIIVSVALVRPRAGVFVDAIKHVLVVATPLEVLLLGVGYDGGRVAGRSGGGDVTLYATQISVPADGVAMTSIVGTADGRVFMAGNDGGMYEFAYQAEDGWLTKKAKKVNLTSTIASYFIPTFLTQKRDTAAVAMAVDDERRLLYVLLQDASIKVYWLGADGTEFVLAHHHRTISNRASLLCPQFNEGSASPFEIASMHVITPQESRTLGLVAVTGGGSRLYFSTVNHAQWHYGTGAGAAAAAAAAREPEVFDLVHVRLPPELRPVLGRPGGAGARPVLNVHAAFCRGGTALMAHTWSEDHDCIVGTAPACAQILGRMARQPRASLSELWAAAQVEGRTWAIAEISDEKPSSSLSDLATVSGSPTRAFAVLTNAGITVLEQQRPVDMLRALLAHPALQDAHVREFVAIYGLDESCAMCYTLLCEDPTRVGMQVLAGARRLLFEFGGVPRVEAPALGSSGDERVVLSGRHNGMAIYLGRVLEPIWARPATVGRSGRSSEAQLHVGVATSTLVDVQDQLRRLLHFITTNQRFVPDQLNQMPVQPAGGARGDAASCWQTEAASLGALYELMVHSIEAISFLCLLADFNLPAVSEGLPEAQRRQLAGIAFSQLVCGDAGREACRELILALINTQMKQDISIDSLSDVLTKRCASMFSASDVMLYKALELLRGARESEEGTEASDLAQEALNLLSGVAGTLSAAQLRDICASFEALGQHGAVAALALACARQSDPGNEAMAFWRDGAPENDAREPLYRKRMECYQCVVGMLEKRGDSALNGRNLCALPSDDALFQFVLYDWLLEHGQSTLLFDMPGGCVEQYLSAEPRSVEKGDMLWHYYVHSSQFHKAALVQRELACSREFDIGLAQRIEYLSLAIGNVKIALDAVRTGKQQGAAAAAAAASDDGDGLTALRETEDQLEVAQVQLEIQQQVQSQGHMEVVRELDLLYTISELYDRFAYPLRLWDAMLLIFRVSNHDDRQLVTDVWTSILRTALDDAERTGLMAVASKVTSLGPRLYPSPAFPLATITAILVGLARERPQEYTPGFVASTLVQAGVPHAAVFHALNAMITDRAPSNDMLVREVAALAVSWVDSHGHLDMPDTLTADSLPIMEVDTALSQYIINSTLATNIDLKNELQRAQVRLRQTF